MAATLKRHDFRASVIELVVELHGGEIFDDHPQERELVNYYDLILKSLVDSGDLEGHQGSYLLAPGAMRTLADYELEERRHTQIRARQTVMAVLTLVLAIVGAAQIYHDFFLSKT